MRKLIVGAVSVLALGIGGAALDYVADADDAVLSAAEHARRARNFATLDKHREALEGRRQVGTGRTSHPGPLQ